MTLLVRDSGTLVSGTIPMIGGARPLPEFFDLPDKYKPSNYPVDYPAKNDSLKILIGMINIEDSPEHLTTNLNSVIGIYELPYELEPGLTIAGVDQNGTVEISFNGNISKSSTFGTTYGNESVHLGPGATWTSPIVSSRIENKTITFPGVGGTDYPITMSYARSYEIDNKGVFDK